MNSTPNQDQDYKLPAMKSARNRLYGVREREMFHILLHNCPYENLQPDTTKIQLLARKPFSRREWNGTKRDTKFVSLYNENKTFVLLLSEREFG